jgi:hypothetical protein
VRSPRIVARQSAYDDGHGMRPRPGLRPPLLGAILFGALAAALAAFDPATTWWFPSCPFHALTGWQCPLCGSLRAIHALCLGAPLAALAFNPLTIIGLAGWLIARAPTIAFCFSARGVGVLIGFGLLRNL